MEARKRRPFLPATGLGWAGVVVALLGLAALVVLISLDRGPDTPAGVPGLWVAWLGITVGAAILFVALRRGERSLLALIALVPFALFVILLLMELTGLME